VSTIQDIGNAETSRISCCKITALEQIKEREVGEPFEEVSRIKTGRRLGKGGNCGLDGNVKKKNYVVFSLLWQWAPRRVTYFAEIWTVVSTSPPPQTVTGTTVCSDI